MKNDDLKKYKNVHKGKRVFLIGNGPSLAKTNLDLIKDEYSIAMCRISLIYPKTTWDLLTLFLHLPIVKIKDGGMNGHPLF